MQYNWGPHSVANYDFKKVLVFVVLCGLVLSAFGIQLNVFIKSRVTSVDEAVYYRMGQQVMYDWRDYNTIPYAEKLTKEGRDLPEYFFQPLYKHPPLFTFLVSLSMKLFGPRMVSAEYVSLLFGVLLIPLTYLLGSLFYGPIIGLLSAFFVFLDPVTIMTSQKLWPDTTLAFFMVLTVYLFATAIKKNRDIFLTLSGLSLGLAVLTKYPGALPLAGIILYSLFYDRKLIKSYKFFVSYFIIPLGMLMPWLFWNYSVYGLAAVTRHQEIKALGERFGPVILLIAIICMLVIYFRKRYKMTFDAVEYEDDNPESIARMKVYSYIFIFLFIGVGLKDHLIRGMQFDYIPVCSWVLGFFGSEPRYFYFGRLLEYSLIYGFAFAALLMYQTREEKEIAVLRLAAFVILIFLTIWGNFQSRYILASIPFLIIMGVQCWAGLLNQLVEKGQSRIATLGVLVLIFIFIFIVARTLYLNTSLSYTNNMCYF